MAYSSVPTNIVKLPLYAGFTQFAIWPSSQLVKSDDIYYCYQLLRIKSFSCYGLLDTNSIFAPIQTGKVVEVAFYPGCFYTAYRAVNDDQVIRFIIIKYFNFYYRHQVLLSMMLGPLAWFITATNFMLRI